ncbi:MAG: tetratricopeptide repeat protein [Halieaceae bacterium]|nr:tetratricopeptide repeat protein [Halieaceae bacterium]
MESYRTEEEQVEALKRWWDENGRSIILAAVIALAAGFGWQNWKDYDQRRAEGASALYQEMLEKLGGEEISTDKLDAARDLALELKSIYPSSGYAQFASLHLAKMAVTAGDMDEAEVQLRAVLNEASKGSDMAQIVELRLARVIAAKGDADQALAILSGAVDTTYQASYAMARGDILMQQSRLDEARAAYASARILIEQSEGQANIPSLDHKLQNLNPIPPQIVTEAVLPMGQQAETSIEPLTKEEN